MSSEWSSVIDILSVWIKGTDSFIEIYDLEAIRSTAKKEASSGWVPGVNSDLDAFVAERNSPYSTSTQTALQ